LKHWFLELFHNVNKEIEIRECKTLDELAACVDLQREVFALPEIEISPVRHFVVTKNAGGFILGAFAGSELVGFVLSVPAFLRGEKAFYSHMTAVRAGFQGSGVGASLKWAQRQRALTEGVKFIKWTFEPVKARNAFFNLEKLGAIVTEYEANFYGVDYSTSPDQKIGLASDRLFAEWRLESDKVIALAEGKTFSEPAEPKRSIVIPADWSALVNASAEKALAEQLRIRKEFAESFADGLVGRGFVRDATSPCFLLFEK
jgi:predicted GNAT superfamily acetyltransferase